MSKLLVAVAEDTREEYFDFEVVGPTITINGYDGPDGEVRIPRTIMGLPVTRISEGFYAFRDITSIAIPDNVTIIGEGAFSGCTTLMSIEVHAENPAYSSLDGVLFDKSQEELIFYPKGKTGDYAMPENVIRIRKEAFYRCTNLTSIIIPNSVISIGNYAFWGCIALTGVTIGNGVTGIGEWAFAGCISLTSIVIPDSVISIGDHAFWDCIALTSLTIGTGVTSIGRSAFSECSSLTSIVIPDSVTSIADWTFRGCTALTSVTIGNGVTSIGNHAFSGCTNLTTINVAADNQVYSSLHGVLFDKHRTELILCPQAQAGQYAIPDSVTSIGGNAFTGCTSLTSIAIPDSVTSIGTRAFAGCTSLTSVTIGNGVTSIGYAAFDECRSLTSIVIPDSVNSIGASAFRGCTALTSVTIGNGLTSIDRRLFPDSPGLESIEVSSDNPEYSSLEGVLFNRSGEELIWCPQGKAGHYFVPDGVKSIGGAAFVLCSELITVTIPNSVESIGWGAFTSCTGLTSITIGSGVTTIDDAAFSSCVRLTSVYFWGALPSLPPPSDVNGVPLQFGWFFLSDNVTVYYLPGTAGWGSNVPGRPTAPWVLPNPVILTSGAPRFGVQTEGFTLTISWATEDPIVVEAISDLDGKDWITLYSGPVADGYVEITDPDWGEHRARFYRVRVP